MATTLILSENFVKTRIVPQIQREADTALDKTGLGLDADERASWGEAIALTVLGDGEIEVHDAVTTEASRIAGEILERARLGDHHDLVLHLALWWRYLHGDEQSVPKSTYAMVQATDRQSRRRRRRKW